MEYRSRGYAADQGRSYGKIEMSARRWRIKLCPGIPVMQAFPALQTFERLNKFRVLVRGKLIHLDYSVERLPTGYEAATRYDEETTKIIVALSPETYAGLEDGNERDRFSSCHEIAHAVLHRVELVRWGQMRHRDLVLHRVREVEHPIFHDTEWQADTFAGEILVPSGALDLMDESQRNASFVAHRFEVSGAAARKRLEQYTKRCEKQREQSMWQPHGRW